MKNRYKTLGIAACLTAFVGTLTAQTAQKDSTLNRQIMLEREYTPTLQDASKINTVPVVREAEVKSIGLNFETGQPRFNLAGYPLGRTGSGDINSAINFSKHRGYFGLSGGAQSRIDGKAGYRILGTKTDLLDVFARYNSSDADVDYLQSNYTLKEAKAKYSDALIKAKYEHMFDAVTLFLQGSFSNTGYNYYGNSYWTYQPGVTEVFPYNLDKKQNVDVINLKGGVKSTQVGAFNYAGSIDFNSFSTKFGPNINDKGLSGTSFDINLDVNTPFGHDKIIGVDLGLTSQSFSDVKFARNNDVYHSLLNFKANPYIAFEGGNWSATLGANIHYIFDVKNRLLFAPNVKAAFEVAENSSLYASVGGGINENKFLDIFQENRYVDPSARVEYSKTIYDATLGFKSGILSGFEFDVFAGYKKTDNDHLYVAGPAIDKNDNLGDLGNVGRVLYADVSTGHFGAGVKTNLIPYTDLSLRVISYFYDVKMADANFLNKAWNKPSLTAELGAVVKPIDKLSIALDYLYSGGRKTTYLTGGESLRMKNIAELNARADYEILDWLSLNAQVKNLLNAEYDIWRGYTQHGFAILGGVNIKF